MIGWYVLNCNESFAMHTHTHTPKNKLFLYAKHNFPFEL